MKIIRCPNCYQQGGFLTFRYVGRWNRPYIGHYDSKRYEEQLKKFQNGERKSKPDGRRWCSITWFELIKLTFNENWYQDYQKLLHKIHEKYIRYGFRDIEYVFEMCKTKYKLEKIRKEFIEDKHWSKEYHQAFTLLQKNRFPKNHIQKKIFNEISWKMSFGNEKMSSTEKDILLLIGLD